MPRSIAHLTRNARPIASTTTEPRASNCGNSLLDQQQPAEDQQEDADPRQARPTGVVGPPFPVVDADGRLAGHAPAAVRAEPRHRFLLVVHEASSACLVSALGVDRVEQRLAGQVAPDVLDDELVEEAQRDAPTRAA